MKRTVLILTVFVAILAGTRPALPWGSAVHAYIGAHLGDRGIDQKDMIYGGVAPDTFNFLFDDPAAMEYLYGVSHGLTPYGTATVLAVKAGAATEREATFGVGWYSHNNVDAADMTAHGYPYNDPSGYIIQKALILREILRPFVEGAGITIPEPVFLEVSHILAEYGADLLMRDADRSVGALLIASASTRSEEFPLLVADTYGPGLAAYLGRDETEARELILREEAEFRGLMLAYGDALQMGDAESFEAVAGFIAGQASAYLSALGIPADDEQLLPIIRGGVLVSMELCRPDLMAAVDATIAQTAAVTAPLR
jgi:hypothetical protein